MKRISLPPRRLLLALLILLPLLFAPGVPPANWRIIAAMAILTSASILAILYAVAYGFGMNELKFLAVEEFYQLLVTIVMIAALVGAQASLEGMFTGSIGTTLPAKAQQILDDRLDAQQTLLDNLQELSAEVGEQSSKSAFCSIMGVGMSIAGCGGYRALSTPISFTYQMVAAGIAELNALHTLSGFAQSYAFLMLLPAGILLRTFRITRGAGGVFIAFAISLYALLPLGVIAVKDLSDQAFADMVADDVLESAMEVPSVESCSPFGIFDTSLEQPGPDLMSGGNAGKAQAAFNDMMKKSDRYIYEFLVNATLTAILGITMLVAGTRAIAHLTGADVDTSILARVA